MCGYLLALKACVLVTFRTCAVARQRQGESDVDPRRSLTDSLDLCSRLLRCTSEDLLSSLPGVNSYFNATRAAFDNCADIPPAMLDLASPAYDHAVQGAGNPRENTGGDRRRSGFCVAARV